MPQLTGKWQGSQNDIEEEVQNERKSRTIVACTLI